MKIGNLDISSFKVGAADCSIYLGDVKLYPLSPSLGDKAILHLLDGTEVNIPQTASTDTTLSYSDVSSYSNVKYVELTDNVASISDGTFAGMTNLQYIKTDSSTPATIGTALDGTYPIYVSYSNLSTYQSSWSSISSRIKAYDDYYTLSLTDIDLLGYTYIDSYGNYNYGDTTATLQSYDNYKVGSIATTVNMSSYTAGGSSSQPLEVYLPSTVTNLTMYRQYTTYLNMICLATTPPTMSRVPTIGSGRWNFYVPDEAVSTYQSSQFVNWYDYIHPISEWTGDASYFG